MGKGLKTSILVENRFSGANNHNFFTCLLIKMLQGYFRKVSDRSELFLIFSSDFGLFPGTIRESL